jgi:hypothetical protein
MIATMLNDIRLSNSALTIAIAVHTPGGLADVIAHTMFVMTDTSNSVIDTPIHARNSVDDMTPVCYTANESK